MSHAMSGRHDRSKIRAAHAGRKGTQSSIGAGVAVRTDHQIARNHQSLFRKDDVLDPAITEFIVVPDVLFSCKLPHELRLLGRRNILVGNKMVGNQGDLVPVKNLLLLRSL